MPGLGLGTVHHSQAALLEPLDEAIDARRRVQRILAAVHDEERLVDHVLREERAAQRQITIAQHEDEAVQRQKAGERRRVAHREEVGAGPAVRDPRQDDAVLVDVVGALDAVDDRRDVLDLRRPPPLRLGPRLRQDVNLFDAGQRALQVGCAALGVLKQSVDASLNRPRSPHQVIPPMPLAQPGQQHRDRQDHRHRVRDVLACEAGGGPMLRLPATQVVAAHDRTPRCMRPLA